MKNEIEEILKVIASKELVGLNITDISHFDKLIELDLIEESDENDHVYFLSELGYKALNNEEELDKLLGIEKDVAPQDKYDSYLEFVHKEGIANMQNTTSNKTKTIYSLIFLVIVIIIGLVSILFWRN